MLSDRLRLFVAFGCLLACLCSFAGCSTSSTDSDTTDSSEKKGGETEAEKCRKKLAGAVNRLKPERLTLQSAPERSINGLNSWIAACAADQAEALELSEEALSLLDANPRATARRYTGADASYIRDALGLRQLTTALASRRSTDDASPDARRMTKIMQPFQWVIRNISLVSSDESRPPIGLFDVMLTGRGTAEERAWVFGELLRQQRIDAVIVTSGAQPATEGSVLETAEWLVAVIQGDGGFLFDMATGIPVSADGSLDQLNPAPAPLTVLSDHERWKDSTVQVIAQIAAFAPRMLVLQDQLAAEDAAVLYEELTGGVSEIRPIRERIVTAGAGLWAEDNVTVWPLPEERVIASNVLTEEQQQQYSRMMRPFQAPFERKIQEAESVEELTTVPEAMKDEEREALEKQRMLENYIRVNQSSEELFGKPSRRLLKVRIRQILGSVDTAVLQQMQQIRLAGMEEVIRITVPEEVRAKYPGMGEVQEFELPKIIRDVNRSSTGSSMYWTALCQLDRNEAGAAIMTLMNYRRQYPEGRWKYPSLINQAMALIAQERTKDATAVLTEADKDDNPERARVQLLLKLLAASATKPPEN